jgi:hypothetical protein
MWSWEVFGVSWSLELEWENGILSSFLELELGT